MIDGQPSTVEDPGSLGPPKEHKHHRASEEEAAKQAEKAAKESEKAIERAEKIAERWEKQQDRLAKLHLDGDKLMLRWLRTSLFLVSAGIAMERGLTYLETSRAGPSLDPYAVFRLLGLCIVLIGLGSLLVSCVHHRKRLHAIRQGDPPPVPSFSLSLWVSVAVAVMSVIAFLAAVVSYGEGLPIVSAPTTVNVAVVDLDRPVTGAVAAAPPVSDASGSGPHAPPA